MFGSKRCILISSVVSTLLSSFLSPHLVGQVTIKEKLSISTHSLKRATSEPTDLTIVFYWTNASSYDLGTGKTPFHLGIYEPNEQLMGFNEFTDSISGTYSDSITWIEYDGNGGVVFYEGQSTYVESNPQPGYYTLYAIADTNASPDLEWGMNVAEVYVPGVLDTMIIFDFRLWAGRVFGTRYNVVVGEFSLPGPPCVPVGAPYFALDNILDLPHGLTASINASILNSCGNSVDNPPESYFKFEISGDTLAGELFDPITFRTGAVLDSVNSTYILFNAWRRDPDSPTQITVTISADNSSISPDSTTFSVLPSEVRVVAGEAMLGDTTVLSYGDTTSLTMQVREPGGPWMDQPDNWWPSWSIVQGDTFGSMYSMDSSQAGSMINGVPVVFYSANSEIAPDSTEVLIQLTSQEPASLPASVVSPVPGSKVAQGQKTNTSRFTPSSITPRQGIRAPLIHGGGGGVVHYGLARLLLKGSGILLGQTKYYQAALCNAGSQQQLTIQETTEWPTQPASVHAEWGVEKEYPPDKYAAYYEYKDPDGDPLPSGWIRLVGRYWEQSSTTPFSVKLTARYGGQTVAEVVQVEKPDKLGDNYGPLSGGGRRTEVHTVFDATKAYNLDSTIIVYAGRYGIAPQIIKGWIQKESNFEPSYRYEPFMEAESQTIHGEHGIYYGSRYRIESESDLGSPTIPASHVNVHPHPYLGYVGTMGDFIWDGCTDINPEATNDSYDIYNSKGEMLWYYDAAETYFETWDVIAKDLYALGPETETAARAAKLQAFEQFKNVYAVGTLNEIAQTRIATSYGLLHPLYTTAVEKVQYDTTAARLPEDLMEVDMNFSNALSYFLNNCLRRELWLQKTTRQYEWPSGFEKTIVAAMTFYNSQGGYGTDIISNAKNFQPKKK